MLSAGLKDTSGPGASLQPTAVREELEKVNADIRALKAQYTEMHPFVQRLEDRARALRATLAKMEDNKKAVQVLVDPASRSATQGVYDDLVRKLNYLNVVLEMEGEGQNVPYLAVIEQPAIPSFPFSPNRLMVYLVAFCAGLLLSGVVVVYNELRRGTFLAPAHASTILGVPLLGELPPLVSTKKLQLLEGPQLPKLLDAPAKKE